MADVDSKLVPILREGVDVVKMILFKNLKRNMAFKHADRESADVIRLCAAVINQLFGASSADPAFVAFVADNQPLVDAAIRSIPEDMGALQIPLSDALRVQFLCDSREGIDSTAVLQQADELNLLIHDRDVPLPKTFLDLVRRLGIAHGILAPSEASENGETNHE
ncbi:MAG: hypothetical protein GXP53_00095 [Deltaproteobacteria bacterium]|nr:hypothetical protein [Deltaproteobacteria bacterium]